MKVLCVGDPHVKVNNIPEVNLFIERLTELAKTQNPDLIILLGDQLDTHERLHSTPLNKICELVDNMRKIVKTYILVGNHDMCFAKNTPILMWDGTTKMSQDIQVGDKLVGDDKTVREVLSLTKGETKMFEIQQQNASNYIVTENHILSLLFPKEYNQDMDIVQISVKNYSTLPIPIQKCLYGFKIGINGDKLRSSIKIVPSKETSYYGWSTDGNHRFLLADFTVVLDQGGISGRRRESRPSKE